jgi:hypothetical protein
MPRVLLVSYHFGPRAATGGFRWTRLALLLLQRGWSFDVLTNDEILPDDLPDGITAHRITVPHSAEAFAWLPGVLPAKLARALQRRSTVEGGRGTSATSPDIVAPADPARVYAPKVGQAASFRQKTVKLLDGIADETRHLGWARAATARARELVTVHRYHAVIVSTPPHGTLVAGVQISAGAKLPFIADFRDPWVLGIGMSIQHMDSAHRLLGKRIEPKVNEAAVAVVHNTAIEARLIGAMVNRGAARHLHISNGHDLTHTPAAPNRSAFILVYAGHMHPWMDPRPFFAACQRLFALRAAVRDVSRIVFMGTPEVFGGVSLRGLAAAYGLSAQFELRPRGPREEANALQESAAVLLAYDCTHRLCVPAKFFDYAYMRGAMLLLGHRDGAMAETARPLGVEVIEPDDAAGIDAALADAFDRWQRGAMTEQNDRAGIYARSRQAAQWDDLLREVGRVGADSMPTRS